MSFDQFRGRIDHIITLLKQILHASNTNVCCVAVTSSGIGSIPAGFASVAITQISPTGTTNILLSDGTTFMLQTQGEVFVDAAGSNKSLPAYTITGTATWKWHGIK